MPFSVLRPYRRNSACGLEMGEPTEYPIVGMRRELQSTALGLYRLLHSSGFLRSRMGQVVFEGAYETYKSLIEARRIDHLRPFVAPSDWIVDVGANIGFFAKRFGRWVSAGGRVLALEPEPTNFRRLEHAIARAGLGGAVEALPVAAADISGELHLVVNPRHPGDHRLGVDGIPVQGETLDSIIAARGGPKVSLIKIDVQGAECRVIAGSRETIWRWRPALYVEVSDQALRGMGASASRLLDDIGGFGYRIFRLERHGRTSMLSRSEALRLSTEGESYVDLLFVSPSP